MAEVNAIEMGMSQNKATRGPHVLVFGSIYQGKPFWVRILDRQMPLTHQFTDQRQALNRLAFFGTAPKQYIEKP